MIYTDHQPYLFGHAGYWSKVFAGDVHVAMFDVAHRQEDHLTTGQFENGPLRMAVRRGERIADIHPINPSRMAKTLEQTIGSRRHRFAHRADPFIELFRATERYDWTYERLWLGMASHMKSLVGATTKILVSRDQVEGKTTLERNVDRLEGLGFRPKRDTYLAGPAIREYATPLDTLPPKTQVHQMISPTDRAFLEYIVMADEPWTRLRKFEATPA